MHAIAGYTYTIFMMQRIKQAPPKIKMVSCILAVLLGAGFVSTSSRPTDACISAPGCQRGSEQVVDQYKKWGSPIVYRSDLIRVSLDTGKEMPLGNAGSNFLAIGVNVVFWFILFTLLGQRIHAYRASKKPS